MIELDVDMGYLPEDGEPDCVTLNDENGEFEPMTFYRDGADAVAFCKRVESAVKEGKPLELFGVNYEAVGDEPFCETVTRWLNGDAPQECRECPDGKYGELTAMVGGGKLTAEQVRELIAPHLDARPTFDFGHHGAVWRADFQAIADELNAAMVGECENVAPDYLDFLCSVCGFVHYHSDENDTGDGNDWAYCPRCGKAVKR